MEGGHCTRGSFKKSQDEKPLIAVITVVLNGETHLEKTILSVIKQTYDNIEYIIVDGGSVDNTVDIIRRYEYAIDYWISEKDFGIYDAMNKGVGLCSSDYVMFLNAGDVILENSTIANMVKFIDSKYELYKYTVIVENNTIRKEYADRFYLSRRMLNHQGLLYKTQLFQRNKYDPNLKIIGDLKHLVEFSIWKNIKYIDYPVVKYLGNGIAAKRESILQNWRERHTVFEWKNTDKLLRILIYIMSIIGITYNIILRIKK